MTKLDYNRPIFRYLDNMKREIKKGPAWSLPDDYVFAGEVVTEAVLEQRKKDATLTKKESMVAMALLEALSSYMDAQSAVISALITPKGKASKRIETRDEAEKTLLLAAQAFFLQMVVQQLNGRKQLQILYKKLETEFTKDEEDFMVWDVLNNYAMKTAGENVERLMIELVKDKS